MVLLEDQIRAIYSHHGFSSSVSHGADDRYRIGSEPRFCLESIRR